MQSKNILLIDEVDVFFSEEFLGKYFIPSFLWYNE